MKKIILAIAFIATTLTMQAQIFLGKESDVSFYAKSPLEDIEAHNKAVRPLLNTITSEILFKIPITSFVFKSSLMQEHFNENYMESDKYPSATFQGKINEAVDYTGDGYTAVTTTGIITLHGVAKPITTTGSITVKGNEIMLNSIFKIHMDDFKIVVPALYSQNIPEDMEITVKSTLAPFSRPGGLTSATSTK